MLDCVHCLVILIAWIIYNVLCRGENGELRLGIRRAVRPRNGLPDSIVGNQNSYPSVLSLLANAISTKSMFHVFYSPRYHYYLEILSCYCVFYFIIPLYFLEIIVSTLWWYWLVKSMEIWFYQYPHGILCIFICSLFH